MLMWKDYSPAYIRSGLCWLLFLLTKMVSSVVSQMFYRARPQREKRLSFPARAEAFFLYLFICQRRLNHSAWTAGLLSLSDAISHPLHIQWQSTKREATFPLSVSLSRSLQDLLNPEQQVETQSIRFRSGPNWSAPHCAKSSSSFKQSFESKIPIYCLMTSLPWQGAWANQCLLQELPEEG